MFHLPEFESIGDNCEFGFVQQKYGIDEGGLLKWARILELRSLIKLISNDFENFYCLENLIPKYDDMVEDKEYGILFHSALGSCSVGEDRHWIETDESSRAAIYDIEYAKREYLVNKFRSAVANDEKILIVKMNEGIPLDEIHALHEALCGYGQCNLLYVETAPDGKSLGQVCNISKGIWRAYIPRFAPYWPVTDYLPGAWEHICQEAFESIRGRRG